ncbi:hypothetical protein PQX77_016355 [Marasmius sp. AFHP31]|nr:hypothetical protein PQX77_016355 [Marasmius sp. AFHP31]
MIGYFYDVLHKDASGEMFKDTGVGRMMYQQEDEREHSHRRVLNLDFEQLDVYAKAFDLDRELNAAPTSFVDRYELLLRDTADPNNMLEESAVRSLYNILLNFGIRSQQRVVVFIDNYDSPYSKGEECAEECYDVLVDKFQTVLEQLNSFLTMLFHSKECVPLIALTGKEYRLPEEFLGRTSDVVWSDRFDAANLLGFSKVDIWIIAQSLNEDVHSSVLCFRKNPSTPTRARSNGRAMLDSLCFPIGQSSININVP